MDQDDPEAVDCRHAGERHPCPWGGTCDCCESCSELCAEKLTGKAASPNPPDSAASFAASYAKAQTADVVYGLFREPEYDPTARLITVRPRKPPKWCGNRYACQEEPCGVADCPAQWGGDAYARPDEDLTPQELPDFAASFAKARPLKEPPSMPW